MTTQELTSCKNKYLKLSQISEYSEQNTEALHYYSIQQKKRYIILIVHKQERNSFFGAATYTSEIIKYDMNKQQYIPFQQYPMDIVKHPFIDINQNRKQFHQQYISINEKTMELLLIDPIAFVALHLETAEWRIIYNTEPLAYKSSRYGIEKKYKFHHAIWSSNRNVYGYFVDDSFHIIRQRELIGDCLHYIYDSDINVWIQCQKVPKQEVYSKLVYGFIRSVTATTSISVPVDISQLTFRFFPF
eukprot:196083_1